MTTNFFDLKESKSGCQVATKTFKKNAKKCPAMCKALTIINNSKS